MNIKQLKVVALTAGTLTALAGGIQTSAQTSDALLDKLVEKGILTVKEANELKEESDQGFNKAYQAKTGMPDWVTSLKWTGDFRGRFEGFSSSNPLFVDQTRWRYRLRFGVIVTMLDDIEFGLRLGSGNFDTGISQGTDPISNNQTLQNNGSKKGIFIDEAYVKWSLLHHNDWLGSMTLGKMENPFVLSDMVFDADYTPEGAAGQVSYAVSEKQTVRLIGGIFVVDNNTQLSSPQVDPAQYPYMAGGQLLLDSTWNKKLSSTVGVSLFGITYANQLVNGAVPNINQGNTRNAGTTAPTYPFSPIIGNASATYTLDRFPFYPGAFPIKLGGEYMINAAAPASADNYGYNVGVQFGKASKKGTWELSYAWKYLGANAWYEELVDSDFGALYQASQPNSGFTGPNYGSGTNVKGNIVKLAYAPLNFVTFSVKWFSTWLIQQFPPGSNSSMNRFQVDATVKF